MDEWTKDSKPLIATLVKLFKLEDFKAEVEILTNSIIKIEQTGYNNWDGLNIYSVFIQLNPSIFVKFKERINELEKSILDRIQIITRPYNHVNAIYITPQIEYSDKPIDDEQLKAKTIEALEEQKNLMISVATGGPRIQEKNEEYKNRNEKIINALNKLKLRSLNPYKDLWDWYGKWSSGDLPTYQSRRNYISALFEQMVEQINSPSLHKKESILDEPTGWTRVDRTLGEIRKRLEEAESEEQFQAVGLLCRDEFISLAEVVYNPDIHIAEDGIKPSSTDSKRMLDAYFSTELKGSTNEAPRKHAKAALALANDLTHKRTAEFRLAALCVEATSSVVNIVAIISGQRDPA